VFSFDLLINALVIGVLLGGFYCSLAMGLSVSFGLLDVVNIAHPAFIILGAYIAYMMGVWIDLDPIITGVVFAPVFFFLGIAIYRIYYTSFEKRGAEALRGLAFFFGLMFIVEVVLIIVYGVDYRSVDAPYVGPSIDIGFVGIPLRMLVPFIVAMLMATGLVLYLSKTFTGRAIQAVAQDRMALQLMGADPVKIKQLAFGISLATCSVAGALMIIIIPIEPSVGRLYIGPVFAIVVLAGLGSVNGTIYAAIIIGVAESIVNTFFGPSWAPAVAFGILLAVLGLRPAGLFGR
jgi:branched-chain amino acid transport system permease protein